MHCNCSDGHTDYSQKSLGDVQNLGPGFDEAWFTQCNDCGNIWLRVLFEAPHLSNSGHWYDVQLPPGADWTTFSGSVENINSIFSNSEIKFKGGSLFNGKVEPFAGQPKRLV
jgi:hypothetical protein